MSPELPAALRLGIERLSVGLSRRDMARRSAAISEHYRAGGGSDRAVAGQDDALAYLLSRLPATYAALSSVLDAVQAALPDFRPATLLDAGAGPGTAAWAAVEHWPGLAGITMLDSNPGFRAIARSLADGSPVLAGARIVAGDLIGGALPQADLVIASYALAELPPTRMAEIAEALWSACRGVLVLVEPGSPAGYRRILECRAVLIGRGGSVLAPCPHDSACPLAAPDWCHFTRRLPRSRDHMLAKSGTVPFEDEKFSYVAAAVSPPASRIAGRILRQPRVGKAEVTATICAPDGIVQRVARHRDKQDYRRLKKLDWGDALP